MASEPRRAGQLGTETNLDFRIEKRAGYDTLVWNDTGCRPATEPEVQLWELLAAQPAPAAAPGIDLTPLWRLSDAWLKERDGERQTPGENRLRWAMAKELRDALSLLDASPKGGSEARDAARLDWLAQHGASLRQDPNDSLWYLVAPYHMGNAIVDDHKRAISPRAAVDAAMQAQASDAEANHG